MPRNRLRHLGAALRTGLLYLTALSIAPPAAAGAVRLESLRIPFVALADSTGARFTARTFEGMVSVTASGEIRYVLPRRRDDHAKLEFVLLRESLAGASIRKVVGRDRARTRVNVIHGSDPRRWQRDLPAYDALSLGEVYPGIEMTLHARGRGVEKIFRIAPGAAPESIRLRVDGGLARSITGQGELAIATRLGEARFEKPIAYQEAHGVREAVSVAYRLYPSGEYGFVLGPYDAGRPLIIDPILAATYYAGSGPVEPYAIDANSNGIYFAGETFGVLNTVSGGAADLEGPMPMYSEGFVALVDAGLNALLAATYLGGSGDDSVHALAVAPNGPVYVAGTTSSNGDFPGIGGPSVDSSFAGTSEGFVVRLSPDLSTVEKATYLGGSAEEGANAIHRDPTGLIFVAGYTRSPDFPGIGTSSADSKFEGYGEAFVARLDADLSTIQAATFLGGVSCEGALDVMRSALGPVYAVGFTRSPDFPGVGTGAADATYQGSSEAWVARLSPDLSTLTTSFIGGGLPNSTSFLEMASSIDEDSAGNLYVGGTTFTGELFPGIGPSSADDYEWDGDGFVVKVNPALTSVLAATFLGGNTWDGINDLKVDAAQRVWVTGYAASWSIAPNVTDCGAGPPDYGIFAAAFDSGLTTILAGECFIEGMGRALVIAKNGVYLAGVTQGVNDGTLVLQIDLGLPPPMMIKIAALKAYIKKLNLVVDISKGLPGPVERAEALGAHDQDLAALDAMGQLVARVERLERGGRLTAEQGAHLRRMAAEIIDGLREEAARKPVRVAVRDAARGRPPVSDRARSNTPPYAWRLPMINIPGDYPPGPKPVERPSR
jgi:hypothetical protein